MAYVSFKMGKESSIGSEAGTSTANPFSDGTLIFAYNKDFNNTNNNIRNVDGRLYIDSKINDVQYRFAVNSECSYFLVNENGKGYDVGTDGKPVYFSGGIPEEVSCILTAKGGTGVTSHTANRLVWSTGTTAIQATDNHYASATQIAINSNSQPSTSYTFLVNGATAQQNGHLYLTGATANSSTSSTTQLVFGTAANNHVVLSSNTKALVINPTTNATTNQIVLYLEQQSLFPGGINATAASTFGSNISVSGNASISEKLMVSGQSEFSSGLALKGITPSASTIAFSCPSASYFTAAAGGYFCFVPNGQEASVAASDLIVANDYVYPGTTNTTYLGKTDNVWKNVYATTFTGDLDGNAASASKLTTGKTGDTNLPVYWTASGVPSACTPSTLFSNFGVSSTTSKCTISATVCTQEKTLDIPMATASNVGLVSTTNQTIAGVKTFSSNAIFNGSVSLNDKIFIDNTSYGTSLPSSGTEGQVFFLLID